MSDNMNVNNQVWTIRVPNTAPRILNQNLWQYDMFGAYPNDLLAAGNDTALFKFDNTASLFLDETARLSSFVGPLLKMLEAQNAQWAQIAAMNLSKNNPTINIVKKTTKSEDDKKVDGTKEIKESEINSTIQRMGQLDSRVGSKKIEYIDPKTGEKKEISLLKRLIQLSKDYQDNPDNPEKVEISEENYKLLWDIAGRYAKSEGDLSREDYLKLIEIAKNPGGPGAYKPDKKDPTKTAERSALNIQERANSANGYKKTADNYFEAMDGAGTDKKLLATASKATTKDNVIETIQAFNEQNELEGDGLTLAEKIFDECDNWGTGNNNGWLTQNLWGDDDARPFIKKLKETLTERADEFISDKKCSKETAEALNAAIVNLDKVYNNISKGDLKKVDKTSMAEAINTLYTKLLNAEKVTYKEFDKKMNITDAQILEGQA